MIAKTGEHREASIPENGNQHVSKIKMKKIKKSKSVSPQQLTQNKNLQELIT